MIRDATAAERGYCRAVWLAAILRGSRSRHKRSTYPDLVLRLVDGERVLVEVAPGTNGRAEDVGGFVAFTPLASSAVVHFVYTREPRRRRGGARRLLEAAGVDLRRPVLCTFDTPDGAKAARAAGVTLVITSPQEIAA